MEVVGHSFYLLHGNVLRQQLVQLIGQLLPVDVAAGVEVSHHHRGMHAGISAAGPRQLHVGTQDERQGALQLALHRDAVWLHLPAMKARAVVA